MDSQDPSAPPPPPFRPHHQPHPQQTPTIYGGPHQTHHTQPQQPNNPYTISSNNNSATTTAPMMQQQNLYPFNTMASASASKPLDHHYSDKLVSGGGGEAGGFSIESARKKRGRPRKYSPDNSIGLGLSPDPATKISSAVALTDSGGGATPSFETAAKRNRGRPPGSGKRQLNALGAQGVGFTPHVITVKVGEDIAAEIMAFSQQGPRTVCILSANGAICNVTLRQPAMSGSTVTYEGRFEIISLSGSFFRSESNGNCSRTGGLSVSLAGSDGRVLGGGVAGMLKAASPVQIVVGSFIAVGENPKSKPSLATPVHMLNSGAPVIGGSSEENDGGPLNHGSEPYGDQQIPNLSMYSNMSWPNSTVKMFPN
ncbi:Hypothetical predicted protein [Olea europaea subsp. europaea]|uniref:AT-hook motif nuclear-localized protein n=1 Tax=Olea europaea subsp. europaea TaxID=158383 RepID=A0A8S0UUV0_OLEEU|nr:Hypothetical predicted protein [Olea europaea subsp. europaea]